MMMDLTQKEREWEREENGRFKIFSFLLVVFMMAGLFHIHHWNQYFFEIFPLKAAQMTGVANRDDLMRIAEICKERRKVHCEATAYRQMIEANNKDYVAMEMMAEAQFLSGDMDGAQATLQNYFLSGGESVRSTYIFAKVLHALSQADEAEKQYLKALDMKPDVVQVSVSEDYVNLLMSQSKYLKAKKFIDRMRRKGAPDYFLGQQYLEITKSLKQSS